MNLKVKQTIERHHMLNSGDTVLVALSGGADSMALLNVLYSIKDEYSLTLCAAHFNHKIRGDEADRDEKFCVEICREMGVELFVESADIPALSKQRGIGEEECGRQERYAFFERVAPDAKVATAHTLSDCEETFLFNLARGASLKGLTSIPPVRGNIIRPLIGCSRDEIEHYCEQNNIEFVTDSTNLQDEYTRNRIRHRAVPELKNINPSFDAAFLRCVNSLREDEELLSMLSDAAVERSRLADGFLTEPIAVLHPSLKRRAVASVIEEMTGEKPQLHHIEAVCGIIENGGDTQVSGGVSLRVSSGVLRKVKVQIEEWCCEVCFGLNKLPYGDIKLELFDKNNKINIQNFNKQLLDNVLNYDKINGKLFFSSIREGDKIRLRGRGVTKQLRRIFSEMHIEPELRRGIPVLRDDDGVVWVCGVGVADRVAVDNSTDRFVIVTTA